MQTNIATIHQPAVTALQPARQIGLTPQSIEEALKMADIMSKASIVPKDYQGNPGNILVAIQWGAEIGLPPLQAMQNLAVINGRPALWGDAVIALVRGSGLLDAIQEDIAADAATCTVKRKGEAPVTRTFSMEDAKKAGLSGKQGPWSQYPKRMLQMRARAWALRDVFPDVLRGVHVAEEAQDMPSEHNMGQAVVVESRPVESRTAAVKAKLTSRAKPSVSLDDVLARIAAADTTESLQEAAQAAAKLASDDDKNAARAAYQERKTAIQQASQPPAPDDFTLTGEISNFDRGLMMIREESTADGLDGIMDWARDTEMTDEERVRFEKAVDDRRAELA